MNKVKHFNHIISDGKINRGCNVDLSNEQYENCRKNDSCSLCTDNHCNKEDINSGLKTTASIMCFFVLLVSCFTQIY